MNSKEHYQELAELFGFPGSVRLVRILRMMMTEKEAFWLMQLPATPGQLAQDLRCTAAQASESLQNLVLKGFALPGEATPTGTVFSRLGIGFLGDFVLSDPRYESLGAAFFDAWREFFNEEQIIEGQRRAREKKAPPGFRVLPAERALPQEGVLDHERTSWIAGQAERIAVMSCPCRRRERRCDHELEVCMLFDGIADLVIQRGAGRPISHDEALAMLERCSRDGLVHDTENILKPRIICNCCPCCCAFLRPKTAYGLDLPVATNRYQVALDPECCSNCQICLERCNFGALHAGHEYPTVQAENCIGCGLCVVACPTGALALEAVRDQPAFRSKGSTTDML